LAYVMLAALIGASGCSGDKPAAATKGASSEDILKKDCADPHWREQNLGRWDSVCRKPMRW